MPQRRSKNLQLRRPLHQTRPPLRTITSLNHTRPKPKHTTLTRTRRPREQPTLASRPTRQLPLPRTLPRHTNSLLPKTSQTTQNNPQPLLHLSLYNQSPRRKLLSQTMTYPHDIFTPLPHLTSYQTKPFFSTHINKHIHLSSQNTHKRNHLTRNILNQSRHTKLLRTNRIHGLAINGRGPGATNEHAFL